MKASALVQETTQKIEETQTVEHVGQGTPISMRIF